MVAYVGGVEYHIVATERDGQWYARADDAARPFGLETSGPTEAVAIQRLTDWLAWQHEHAAALQALQAAERVYHRTIAVSAFANPTGAPDANAEEQRLARQRHEAAAWFRRAVVGILLWLPLEAAHWVMKLVGHHHPMPAQDTAS